MPRRLPRPSAPPDPARAGPPACRRLVLALAVLGACGRELEIPPLPATDPLAVVPELAQVAPLGTATFEIRGGTPPFTAVRERITAADDGASVEVEGATLRYGAGALGGAVDEITVTDAAAEERTVRVAVGAALQIVPPAAYVAAGGETTFVAVGGQPPYRFEIGGEPCQEQCSSVGESTGLYVASPRETEETVVVRDANGATASAAVTTGAALRILQPVIGIAPNGVVELLGFGGRGREDYAWTVTGPDGGPPPAGLAVVRGEHGCGVDAFCLRADPAIAVAAGTAVDAQVQLRDGSPAVAVVNVDVADPLQPPVVEEAVPTRHEVTLQAHFGAPPYTYDFDVRGNLSGGTVSFDGRYVAGPNPFQIDTLVVTDRNGSSASFEIRVGSARLDPADYVDVFSFPSRPYGKGLPIVNGHLLAGRAHVRIDADGSLVPLPGTRDVLTDLVDVYGDGLPEALLGSGYLGMSTGGELVQLGQIELYVANETILLAGSRLGLGLVSGSCRTPAFMSLPDAMLPGAHQTCFDPEYVSVARLDSSPLTNGTGRFATAGSTGATIWQLAWETGVPGKIVSCNTAGFAAIGADMDANGVADVVYLSDTNPARPELVVCLATGKQLKAVLPPFGDDAPVLHAPAVGGGAPTSVILDDEGIVTRWRVRSGSLIPESLEVPAARALLGAGDADGDGALDLVTLDGEGAIELRQSAFPEVFDVHQSRTYGGAREEVGISGVLRRDDGGYDLVVTGLGNVRTFSGVQAATWDGEGRRPGLALLEDEGALPLLVLLGELSDGRVAFMDFTGSVSLVRLGPGDAERQSVPIVPHLEFENVRATAILESTPGDPILLVARITTQNGDSFIQGVRGHPLTGDLTPFDAVGQFVAGGPVGTREGSSPRFVLLDATGDGVLDALLLPEATGIIELHRGSGAGRSFTLSATGERLGTRGDARSIHAGPGGKLHAVFGDGPTRAFGVYENGDFRVMPLRWDAGLDVPLHRARVADVDGDGAGDLILEARRATGEDLLLLARAGTGTDPIDARAVTVPSRIEGFELADLDGDGDLDVVLTISGSPVLHVWDNLGDLSFAPSGAPR